MFCNKCGNKVEGATFCTKCGETLTKDDVAQQMPNAAAPPTAGTEMGLPQDESKKTTKPRPFEWFVGSRFGMSPLYVIGLMLGVVVGGLVGVLIHVATVAILLIRLGLKLKTFIKPDGPKASIGGILQDVIVAVVVLTLVVGISDRVYDRGSGNDKYVKIVKEGTLDAYPQMTVGKAFDGFLKNPKWKSGLAEGNIRYVNVRGKAFYNDREVDLIVQFTVDINKGTFMYNAVEMNDIPQNNWFFWSLLDVVYE